MASKAIPRAAALLVAAFCFCLISLTLTPLVALGQDDEPEDGSEAPVNPDDTPPDDGDTDVPDDPPDDPVDPDDPDPDESCQNCAACGDGTLNPEIGEECDDGNRRDGDGCSGNCVLEPFCGNGELDPGEVCDGGHGCKDSCDRCQEDHEPDGLGGCVPCPEGQTSKGVKECKKQKTTNKDDPKDPDNKVQIKEPKDPDPDPKDPNDPDKVVKITKTDDPDQGNPDDGGTNNTTDDTGEPSQVIHNTSYSFYSTLNIYQEDFWTWKFAFLASLDFWKVAGENLPWGVEGCAGIQVIWGFFGGRTKFCVGGWSPMKEWYDGLSPTVTPEVAGVLSWPRVLSVYVGGRWPWLDHPDENQGGINMVQLIVGIDIHPEEFGGFTIFGEYVHTTDGPTREFGEPQALWGIGYTYWW